MKKLFWTLVLIVLGVGLYFYSAKGVVPEGQTGVLRWSENDQVHTKRVTGRVFSLISADLYVYPLGRTYHEYKKEQAFGLRSSDGFSGTMEVSVIFELDAAGAEKMCASSVASLNEVLKGEARAIIAEGFTAITAGPNMGQLLADPALACSIAQKAVGDELGSVGLSIASIRPLGPITLAAESDRYLRSLKNADQEQALAEHVYATAVLLEGTRAAYRRTQRDSATTVDTITRLDSARTFELSIGQFRKDSTLHMLRYTPGYLENKRLEIIGKAIDKWDGKLATDNKPFTDPFNGLGKTEQNGNAIK